MNELMNEASGQQIDRQTDKKQHNKRTERTERTSQHADGQATKQTREHITCLQRIGGRTLSAKHEPNFPPAAI